MTGPRSETINGSLLICFDRPEQRNPLSSDVIDAVLDAIADIGPGDYDKIIFTGSQEAFASGADLREISKLTPETSREFAERGQRLMNEIESLPIPTVAAINGFCFGGGLDLALSCKKRIASANARFCHPGVSLGIITGWGGTQRLPRLIGETRALEMLLTASQISATDALRIGLIDSIEKDPLAAAADLKPL